MYNAITFFLKLKQLWYLDKLKRGILWTTSQEIKHFWKIHVNFTVSWHLDSSMLCRDFSLAIKYWFKKSKNKLPVIRCLYLALWCFLLIDCNWSCFCAVQWCWRWTVIKMCWYEMSCGFFQSVHDSQLGHLFKTLKSICVCVRERER